MFGVLARSPCLWLIIYALATITFTFIFGGSNVGNPSGLISPWKRSKVMSALGIDRRNASELISLLKDNWHKATFGWNVGI